jgi:catechol 2,3-dioxygenase-like lactoylglutathione lyase family enzyme
MSIVGYDHVQVAIPAGAEDGARAFYGRLLGMAEVPKPPVLAVRGGCWFTSGAAVLHLGVEDPFVPARKAHPAFLVEDLDATAVRLEQLGFLVDRREEWTFPGYRRLHTADGNGNRVELLAMP